MSQQQVQQGAQPSQSQTLTPTEIAAAVAGAMAQHMPQPVQQQRQLSQEEIDQYLGTYRPEMQLVHALFGADPERDAGRLEALGQFVQAIVKNSAAQSQIISQDALRGFYPHIQTDLEAAREVYQQRFYENIYKDHDGLKHYDAMIRHMMPSFEAAQDYPRDRSKQPEYIRNQVINIMKSQNPNFDPKVGPSNPLPHQGAFRGQPHSSGQQHQQTQPQQQPQSTISLAMSGGGGGQGAAARPAVNPSETSWDPDGRGLC